MKHITLDTDDIPVAPILMDRRHTPERRTTWRGGRRDSDWEERPLGAWDRVAATASWRKLLGPLNLW